MTFKHTKFDSPTLRALEKIAVEKGLVKPEPLQKKAAVTKKADYTPSVNLMENIFKLCAGLRDNGLKKEADEIETNYLNYKRAQTLYETSKETGEDLVHDAHPKGSHKLEGVEGNEAVVEDILDQHLKIVEMVSKKPTGKLSTAQIISEVKRSLGETPPAPPPPPVADESTGLTQPVINNVMGYFTAMDEIWGRTRLLGINNEGAIAYNRLKANFVKYMNTRAINNSTIANVNSMIEEAIKGLGTRQAWGNFGVLSDDAEALIFQLKSLKNYVNDSVVDDHKSLISPSSSSEEGQQFVSQVDKNLAILKSWRIIVNNDPENSEQDKAEANKWIDGRFSELTQLKDSFLSEKDPQEQRQKASGYLGALNKSRFAKESAAFKKGWIG